MDKILYYTDGHQVTVTDSGFKVNKSLYQLTGITRHGLSVIHPPRLPFISLIALGTVMFGCGAMNFIPDAWNTNVNVFGFTFLGNSLIMVSGILLLLLGIFVMIKLRDKYAVRISTAEGEKNVVVSGSREYIKQIVDALNRAFIDLMSQSTRSKTQKV